MKGRKDYIANNNRMKFINSKFFREHDYDFIQNSVFFGVPFQAVILYQNKQYLYWYEVDKHNSLPGTEYVIITYSATLYFITGVE